MQYFLQKTIYKNIIVVIFIDITADYRDIFVKSNFGKETELLIPAKIDGKSVTSIGGGAFYDRSEFTKIELSDGIINIGVQAFDDCNNLQELKLPGTVTHIGDHAFSSCHNLTIMEIPESVTYIGEGAFSSCHNLTIMEIPESVTYIGEDAFSFCKNLTDIMVDNKNQTYTSQEGMLFNKSKERLLCCPRGKTGNIELPDNITNIGKQAFVGCDRLTEITLPDSVTHIKKEAFVGCDRLTEITLPDSVTSIGKMAFKYCSSLKSIRIPSSVTSIGKSVFLWCDSLAKITVDNENRIYASENDMLLNKSKKILMRCPSRKKGSIAIPDNMIEIDNGAFSGCSDLTEIEIPNNVTCIRSRAFH